jgi:hypothetical protein
MNMNTNKPSTTTPTLQRNKRRQSTTTETTRRISNWMSQQWRGIPAATFNNTGASSGETKNTTTDKAKGDAVVAAVMVTNVDDALRAFAGRWIETVEERQRRPQQEEQCEDWILDGYT